MELYYCDIVYLVSVSCVDRTSIVISQMILPSMNPSLSQISDKGLGIGTHDKE